MSGVGRKMEEQKEGGRERKRRERGRGREEEEDRERDQEPYFKAI